MVREQTHPGSGNSQLKSGWFLARPQEEEEHAPSQFLNVVQEWLQARNPSQ